MIEVRIRFIDEQDAKKLGDFAPEQIEGVISLFKRHDVNLDSIDVDPVSFIEAAFVEDLEKYYFEIVVG